MGKEAACVEMHNKVGSYMVENGPTGLPRSFPCASTHDIPMKITIATVTLERKRTKQQSVKRIVQVEAKPNRRGYDAPAPPTPCESPTPREYLYAKSMEWTVWED